MYIYDGREGSSRFVWLFATAMRCAMRDARCAMRDARCAMRDARCAMRDARCAMRDARCAMRDARCATRDAGRAMRDARCGTRDAGRAMRDARFVCCEKLCIFSNTSSTIIYFFVRRVPFFQKKTYFFLRCFFSIYLYLDSIPK